MSPLATPHASGRKVPQADGDAGLLAWKTDECFSLWGPLCTSISWAVCVSGRSLNHHVWNSVTERPQYKQQMYKYFIPKRLKVTKYCLSEPRMYIILFRIPFLLPFPLLFSFFFLLTKAERMNWLPQSPGRFLASSLKVTLWDPRVPPHIQGTVVFTHAPHVFLLSHLYIKASLLQT